ncbi:MAG TPA: glycosyltransferase [Mucilaginibacter sp.]|jgi:glycosyltransferase involved in cell wall biosynthesis
MIDKSYRLKISRELQSVLADHKDNFIAKGIQLPIETVPYSKKGLLAQLPIVDGKTGWPWDKEVDSSVFQSKPAWPKITVVIPSYGQAEFIEEAIRSVLLQNYPNLELIIMDGGSKDESKKILERYSPWLSYWQSEKDKGQGQAINMGFSIASGDYYGWLNSDDFYNENAFFVLASEIIRSNKGFYYGDSFSVNKDNSEQSYCKGFLVKDVFLRFGGVIASHSAFWKSSIHQPVWEAMNCNVDGELWIRLVKNQSRKHIKFPIGSLRYYEDTKSTHSNWKDKWKEDDMNIERVHGSPPKPRSFKAYFFRLIQKFYKTYA